MGELQTIINRLKKILDIKTNKELAEKLGIKENTLALNISRNSIPFKEIILFCGLNNISINKLFFGQIGMAFNNIKSVKKNIVGYKDNNRNYIINTLYEAFDGKVEDDIIENSLASLGIISVVSKKWLKEHYIDKSLSIKECAALTNCSFGHINNLISKYGLAKKNYGIEAGNNEAMRRSSWRTKTQLSQPNKKETIVFKNNKFIGVFPSILEVSRQFKIGREQIRDCLNPKKQRNTASGYTFDYASNYIKTEYMDWLAIKNQIEKIFKGVEG